MLICSLGFGMISVADANQFSSRIGAEKDWRVAFEPVVRPAHQREDQALTERNAHRQEYPGPMRLCARAPPSSVP
jgi:hypothetical protein